MRRWWEESMVGLDLETTCVHPEHARIVQAGVVGVSPATNKARFREWNIKPDRPITQSAFEAHGIRNADVADWPSAADMLPSLYDFLFNLSIKDEVPLVIFNAAFDLTVLDREFRRNGLQPVSMPFVIDPFVIDKRIDPFRRGSRKLAAVAAHYRVALRPGEVPHTAGSDAVLAARIAWRMGQRVPAVSGFDNVPAIMRWQEQSRRQWAIAVQDYLRRTGATEEEIDGVTHQWPVIPFVPALPEKVGEVATLDDNVSCGPIEEGLVSNHEESANNAGIGPGEGTRVRNDGPPISGNVRTGIRRADGGSPKRRAIGG